MISVIMIFRDAERFMREALESVLTQTYTNWELLLVDDGSRDSSSIIAQEFARKHADRARYLQHEGHVNRGMSASRNLGIRHMRGAYLAFLDADDVWTPHKLSGQLSVFQSHPTAGMTYGRALIWSSWAGGKDYHCDLGVPGDQLVEPPGMLPVLLRNKAQTPMTGNVLIRRQVLDRVGGFEDSFRGMFEDQVFFAKVELVTPVYVSRACWLWYRQHPESCTATEGAAADYLELRKPFLRWFEQYIKAQGVPEDSPVWDALRREQWPQRHPRLHAVVEPLRSLLTRAVLFARGE